MIGWLALILAILLNTAGNFFIKRFSLSTEIQGPLSFIDPWFIAGITLFGANVFFYSRALRDIPLVVAYPILIGISVALVAILAGLLLKERFGMAHAAGLVLIVIGVSCLAWAEWRS